ncbi:hypothetical protein BDM02DRAFT_3118432, partial [Thelephora ganbajun]
MPPLGLTTPESQEAQRAAARKRFRLFSPAGPADNDALPSAKRRRTTTSALPAIQSASPPPLGRDIPKNLVTPTKKQGVFGSGLSTKNAKGTPVRPLGAA